MGYITGVVSGYPSKEESNGLHHPCRPRFRKWGKIKWARSPLPSAVPQVGRIQMGFLTLAISGNKWAT